jgi:hypothetical protein
LIPLDSYSIYSSQQSHSARLEGIGNLSIAVPEPESEAFINPAKAALTTGILLRFHPNYLHFNNASENTYSSSSYNSKSKDEYSTTSVSFPLDALISIDIFHLGASYSREVFSLRDYSENGSIPSINETHITNYGSTTKLLANIDLGILSVGAMRVFSGTDYESKDKSNNYTYYTGTDRRTVTREVKSPIDFSNKDIRLGALLYISSVTQLSALVSQSSTKIEQQISETRYDGILQPNYNPSQSKTENVSNFMSAELRQRFSDTFLLGIRVQRTSLNGEDYYILYYTDYRVPTFFTERKDGESDATEYSGGVGVSFQPSEGTLISIEFEFTSFKNTRKSLLVGYNYLYPRLHAGDVISESKYSGNSKTLRAGGEIAITSFITLRTGVEAAWQSYDEEYKSYSDYSIAATVSKYSGNTSALYTGRLGATLNFSILRIDYALALQGTYPLFSEASLLSSSSIYPSLQADMRFRHYLTATFQL